MIVEDVDIPATKLDGEAGVPSRVKSEVTVTTKMMECVWPPPVPVTVKLYDPAGVEEVVAIVKVDEDVPPGVRLGPTESDAVRPGAVDGVETTERLTVPVSPRLVTRSVEVVDPPATKLGELGGEAVIVKSGVTVTEIVGVFDRETDPLTPVTEIVYTFAGVNAVDEMVSVKVEVEPGVRSMLDALRLTVNPGAWGDAVAARLTVPVKPRLETLTADVDCPPATKAVGDGWLDRMMKSEVTES